MMEYLPREDGFPLGFALGENHPPSGDIPSWYPHQDVIFVKCTCLTSLFALSRQVTMVDMFYNLRKKF